MEKKVCEFQKKKTKAYTIAGDVLNGRFGRKFEDLYKSAKQFQIIEELGIWFHLSFSKFHLL